MTVLRSVLSALAALSAWGALILIATPIHQLLFQFIPPDGPVSAVQRIQIDDVSRDLILGQGPSLMTGLKPIEVAHLQDVGRVLRSDLLPLVGLSLIGLLLLRPTHRSLAWAVGLTVLIGLVSLALFDPLFTLMHQLLFPSGGWELPSDQFVLTQVYPLGFFGVAWGMILVLSELSLLALRKAVGK